MQNKKRAEPKYQFGDKAGGKTCRSVSGQARVPYSSHRIFSSGLSTPRAIALPSLLLHVFLNMFVIHLQILCDVMAINSSRYSRFDFAE